MIDASPLWVTDVDLAGGLPGPLAAADGRDVSAVFWWRGLPLGQRDLAAGVLEDPVALAAAVAVAVTPAVDALLPPGTGPDGNEPLACVLARLDAVAAVRPPRASVSVIVCTRGRPSALATCLGSLAGLTYPPHEVLVVDNAPRTEPVAALVASFPGVRYLAEPTPGLSVARNTGVAHATGEILAFTDDDAVVHPDWTARLAVAFSEDAVMAVTGLVLPAELSSDAQVLFERVLGGFGRGFRRLTYDAAAFGALVGRGFPAWRIGAGANMALRRDALERVGGFDPRLGAGAAGCSEDSELWYRLLAEGFTCRYEPAAVVYHRHRDDLPGLRRQSRAYLQGHVAALFVQYARYRHWGNLHRAVLALPRYLLRRAPAGLAPGAGVRRGLYVSEVGGYLEGLRHLPLAWRPLPLAALPTAGRDGRPPLPSFLRRNPYPHPYTEGFYYREKMRAVHRVAPPCTHQRILEVGGGQSALTSLLYPEALVVNVDLEVDYATSPLNRRAHMRFLGADATRLPFPDACFDAVTMFDVLEHIPDDARAVAEGLRVLRPGGWLLITSPNERWRYPYYRLLQRWCPTDAEVMADWGHVRRGYTLDRLQELVGVAPAATATFINPVTVVGHDLGFSRLPGRVRRGVAALLAPVTWSGYLAHGPGTPGTETASAWRKPQAGGG